MKSPGKFRGAAEIIVGCIILLAAFSTGGAGGGAFLAVGMFVALVLIGVGCAHLIGEPSNQ
jgi:hypothetical protein